MNTNVFDSINELKKVFAESQVDCFFTVIPKDFDAKVTNAAESHRDKMIKILNQFYKENYQSSYGIDDFVTLFGVYCNYYILCGLHIILKEDEYDFGTSKIFENISNNSLKEYLSLIRSAICTQDTALFEKAVEKNKNYSLAHFYLFLKSLRKYWNQSNYAEQEEALLKHYRAIRNEELKKYALGISDFIPSVSNYIIKVGKNFLLTLMAQVVGSEIEKIKEIMGTYDKSFDSPPLPCPYLMTTEELQRLAGLSHAYVLWIQLHEIYSLFVKILFNEACHKDFSDTLSFIVNEGKEWSDYNEAHSNLLRFFEERKIDPIVALFIPNILFAIPEFLEKKKESFHSLIKGDFKNIFSEDAIETKMQINLGLEKIYLNEQPIFSRLSDTLEKIDPNIDKLNNKFMIGRSFFLGIPRIMNWTNQELYNLMERITAEDEKDTMVRDFMHTYSNMKADTLRDMAQLLLKRDNPEDKKNGRNLLTEYAMKMELSNSVYIMQLMYKDSVDELKNVIKRSLVDEEDDHESVIDIFNKSLVQCFINIFYIDPKIDKMNTINGKIYKMIQNLRRKEVFGKIFPENKREQFEQKFMEQNFDCLEWLSQEGINFKCEQETVWEKILFKKEGFSSTFLKIIFDELCVNVFKYGDLTKEIRLSLSENESKDLVISFENYFTRSRVASGSQIGLNLLRRRIQILHDNIEKKCVEVVDDKIRGFFRIKLLLPEALFLNQGF